MNRATGYEPLYRLKPVAPDLWIADGGWIRFYGLPFPTRMTVIRLNDGGLWVHSPIADNSGLADAVAAVWAGQIDQRLVESACHREVVFFHHTSRTLILTDLIENFEAGKMPWWIRPLLRLGRVCDPDGRMPRDMAASFRPRAAHLHAVVDTMIGWQPERVILAHGRWYDRSGTAELKRAFRDVIRN